MTTALQDPPTSMLPVDRDQVRVLVVEDSPDHRMLIERSLRGAGYLVTGASTGEQALDMLLDVEVVLIDQRLPQMSGTDLLREIVALPTGPAPVIVTGTESRELVVEALRLGAVDDVVKSADYLGELPAVVQRAHRQHDLARRYRELQRFALLVHEPPARDDAVSEIVAGARRLLSVDGASLLRREASGSWEVTARDGEVGDLDNAVAMVASGRDEVVRDQGVGIDPSDAHRVFEPFWRASAAVTHGVRGTGIGLSLVREYVTAMGGEVGVESTPATGSTFWFTLPRTGVTDQTDA